jgi:hypothetical protein
LLGAGDRAGRACSMTRSPRTPAERPGLWGSAARRLPRTPSAACQRAALHGPGQWHRAAPDEVPWIVRRCLRGHPQTQTRCAPMPSRPPPEGPMTFRPCSDAYADKTDLHAYDGDHPKLSHRTERRLSQVHLQEVLQDKGFSVVDMSQTRVPREEQNRRAASRRSVGAGHVGDTVSAASWTPLKITCLRRGAYLTNTPRQLHRRHPKAGLR